MYPSRKNADVTLFAGLTVGILALAIAAVIALLTPQASSAFAADSPVVPGVFGIGERTSAPLSATPSSTAKLPEMTGADAVPAVMTRSVARAAAPAQKVTPKPAAKKRITYRASRSVSTSGWRSGRVSWYGPGFYGHGMAGGGKLTPTSMVLAHRSLPFGTKVAIKYRGKTVVGVVMDRGPFISGRVFDLGPGIAHALGFSGVGTVNYKILGR